MNLQDARVRYTRKVLHDTLLSLLKEKDYNAITVTEVCALAKINRATFYKHYSDIPSLLRAVEDETMEKMSEELGTKTFPEISSYLLQCLEWMKKKESPFPILCSRHGNPGFSDRVISEMYREFYPVLEEKLEGLAKAEKNRLYIYITAGCGGVLKGWFRSGMKEKPETVASFILETSGDLVSTVRSKKLEGKK